MSTAASIDSPTKIRREIIRLMAEVIESDLADEKHPRPGDVLSKMAEHFVSGLTTYSVRTDPAVAQFFASLVWDLDLVERFETEISLVTARWNLCGYNKYDEISEMPPLYIDKQRFG